MFLLKGGTITITFLKRLVKIFVILEATISQKNLQTGKQNVAYVSSGV